MSNATRSKKLILFAKELLTKNSLEEGLPHIAKYAKEVMEADRCSIFLFDEQKNELWTTLADGMERIVIPADKGIVGYTLKVKKPVITNDAYNHPEFLPDVDKQSGYKTQSIITAPIFDSQRHIVGVLELLNKPDGFDAEDMKFMIFFAHYISGFIEMLRL